MRLMRIWPQAVLAKLSMSFANLCRQASTSVPWRAESVRHLILPPVSRDPVELEDGETLSVEMKTNSSDISVSALSTSISWPRDFQTTTRRVGSQRTGQDTRDKPQTR